MAQGMRRMGAGIPMNAGARMFMSIRDSDLEYLIDVRGIDEARVWLKYDDGFLTIGCDEHLTSAIRISERGGRYSY